MLMDLAFESIEVPPKRRVHFHEFMLEVHERLRVERLRERGDPIPPVAQKLAAEARLLAFDEMVINNSADAMILSRLFGPAPEGGSDGGHHVQPAAPGPLQGRPQPGTLPSFHRLDRSGARRGAAKRSHRLPAGAPWRDADLVRAQWAGSDAGAERGFLPADRLFCRGSGERAFGGHPGAGRAHAPCPKEPQGVAVFSFRRLCGRRGERPIIWRSRAAITA
jgi:cell division protein ZapE